MDEHHMDSDEFDWPGHENSRQVHLSGDDRGGGKDRGGSSTADWEKKRTAERKYKDSGCQTYVWWERWWGTKLMWSQSHARKAIQYRWGQNDLCRVARSHEEGRQEGHEGTVLCWPICREKRAWRNDPYNIRKRDSPTCRLWQAQGSKRCQQDKAEDLPWMPSESIGRRSEDPKGLGRRVIQHLRDVSGEEWWAKRPAYIFPKGGAKMFIVNVMYSMSNILAALWEVKIGGSCCQHSVAKTNLHYTLDIRTPIFRRYPKPRVKMCKVLMTRVENCTSPSTEPA